jgi:putative ABC transport system permease protein
MVIGAKGSPLQLILSQFFHIDAPTGNISFSEFSKVSRHPLVEKAIPMSFGDSYEGYRIVGTNHDYPEHYSVELSEGSLWNKPMEAVIGHNVAQELKLGIGDTFFGVHGLTSAMEAHDAHPYTIKGIFKQGNSVLDQLILTSLESVWHIHDHEEEAHHAEVENQKDEKEITAMLISFRNSMGMFQLPRMINENTNMQAAVPAYEVSRINNILGTGNRYHQHDSFYDHDSSRCKYFYQSLQ